MGAPSEFVASRVATRLNTFPAFSLCGGRAAVTLLNSRHDLSAVSSCYPGERICGCHCTLLFIISGPFNGGNLPLHDSLLSLLLLSKINKILFTNVFGNNIKGN